ncbi:hypothetical protein E2C01_016726 [Portunus trituberculatus]|uniref:Uncharacterized protein n=1 Tax=Portunus trituberculatus TaxID=210409 RepID=A0A5B7DRB2_PORTR|nr:hypothetical protein [Portunus trituberculatus]
MKPQRDQSGSTRVAYVRYSQVNWSLLQGRRGQVRQPCVVGLITVYNERCVREQSVVNRCFNDARSQVRSRTQVRCAAPNEAD